MNFTFLDPKRDKKYMNFSRFRLTDEYERPIQLEVAVEESLTGRRQNVSMQMTLHKHPYTMELIKTSEYYKPGLKYTAFIKLTNHDGSPVRDTTNPVTISYGYTSNESAYTNITRNLDEHGMIQLDFYPPISPDETVLPLNIEVTSQNFLTKHDKKKLHTRMFFCFLVSQAQYMSLHEWFPSTNQASSPSSTYIQATLKTEKPMPNHDIEIEVNSTAPLKYLSYEILGRGDILNAGSIQVYGKNTASFRFLATYVMAPTAHVLVYYSRDDGEIVADALDVDLQGTLQNFVDIKMSTNQTAPGDSVDITISAKPDSYIGLLGVDQRSLILKSGNDISYVSCFYLFLFICFECRPHIANYFSNKITN